MTLQEPGDLGYNGFHVSLFYLAAIDTDHVQDPNVTIALKNLAKKNAVTKEKRLNEFLRMIENATFDVRDYHILVCWLQLYPRLAIDSQKSVRHLAHQIQAAYMNKYGPREFSKYLKTAMPIWLQGIFDDKSVALSVKSDLLRCFSGDEAKVNHKVWVLFHEQIVNYCHAVLVHESASTITDERSETTEEVALKYDRAVNSAIMMILQLIRLANSHHQSYSDTASVQMNEILTLDQFWENVGSCASKDNLNTALLRSYFALISEIFSLDNEGSLRYFTSNVQDLKAVFKTVSKKFVKNVKLAPSSEMSSTIAYSTVILPLLNALVSLTCFTNQSSVKLKKSFWQYGGLKSYSRLKDILRLGPCNSDPAYYDLVSKLFTALSAVGPKSSEEFPFLDFGSTKEAKSLIQKILLPHFQRLRGQNAVEFKLRGMRCLVHVFRIFEGSASDPMEFATIAQKLFINFLDGISASRLKRDELQVKKDYVSFLAQFLDSSAALSPKDLGNSFLNSIKDVQDLKIGDEKIIGNPVDLCTDFCLVSREISIMQYHEFLQSLFDMLEETFDDETLGKGLKVLLNTLSSVEKDDMIGEWAVLHLPGFVSASFVDSPLSLLRKILETGLKKDYGGLVNDFFLKLLNESPQSLHRLFTILRDVNFFDHSFAKDSSPDAFAHLILLSRKTNRLEVESDLIFAFIREPEILSNLMRTSEDYATQKKLIDSIVHIDQVSQVAELPVPTMQSLIVCALNTVGDRTSATFLDTIEDKELVRNVIFGWLLESKPASDFSSLVCFLKNNMAMLPIDQIESEVNRSLECVDLACLSISNSLFQNVNLIQRGNSTVLPRTIFIFSALLRDLSKVLELEDLRVKVLRNICAEYIIDYTFLAPLSKQDTAEENGETPMDASALSGQVSEESIIQAFNNTSTEGDIAVLMNEISGEGPYTVRQYYVSRVLVRALTPTFESLTLSSFDGLGIAYTKLSSHPLKLATLLCSATKFIGVSTKLDRIRNFVFAEILGVRTSAEISKAGLVWLSLADSFCNVDFEYDVLQSHKLGMLVNHLTSWLECDIAFDALFISVRSLLASFVTHLIQSVGNQVPDKIWSLAVDLCLNNFGMAQLNRDTQALEYFTLRLFLELSKRANVNSLDDWSQSRASIEEEILDLVVAKRAVGSESRTCNQPVILVDTLIERALRNAKFSKLVLAENAQNLYQLLSESETVSSQRIAYQLLRKYVYDSQQDTILEVQMRKSNLSGDAKTVSDLTSFKDTLMQTISDEYFHLEDALDNENYKDIFKYVWSWILVFDHFKESTYSMKFDYISQLKANNSIVLLLNTIFETLPLSDQRFFNQLSREPVEKGEKVKPVQSLIQDYETGLDSQGYLVREEVYFSMAHLCYLVFQYMGSFALHWFNEIRDVQLKQQVEKFTVRFISPILISEMLDEVETCQEKLTKNDDTLTIKVNKVINEIKSTYVIDEQTMEMVIRIPERFPLSNVLVEGPVRLGVKENQWRAWLLASQRVITLTNGSIFDSIELFNKNVNLHFSGFEECAICYSILHQDHSLPSKNCPTCLNKFHAACLYKWFKSSGSSTCPLCRSAFNFNAARS